VGVHEEAEQASPSATLEPTPLLEALGVEVSLEILERALTHSSYAYEQGGLDNERLEFLGDAVLGQAITHALYLRFPDLPEGELAKRRASIVSTSALAEVAQSINLGAHLRLGRGEELTGGREKPSLLADTLEALIAAVFLDQGPLAATACVERLMGGLVDDADAAVKSVIPRRHFKNGLPNTSSVPRTTRLPTLAPITPKSLSPRSSSIRPRPSAHPQEKAREVRRRPRNSSLPALR